MLESSLTCFSIFVPICFQVCYARILDLKRKFLEAALRYYDISQIEKRKIGDEYVPSVLSFPRFSFFIIIFVSEGNLFACI